MSLDAPRGFWVMAAWLCGMAAAHAQSPFEHSRHYHTDAGQEVRVGAHASWGKACLPGPIPLIRVVDAPRHGSVTTRPGSHVVRESLGNINCTGRKLPAVLVFYQPNPGFVGPDHLSYQVDLPSHQLHETIDIDVE